MKVVSLHVYPIKGCRGHAVPEAAVDRLGFVGDRRLMLVDMDGRFLSQREAPSLATIDVRTGGGRLQASAPDCDPLTLDIDPDGPVRTVSVWESSMTAHDQGDDAALWFSAVIAEPCRLVAYGPASRRGLNPKWVSRTDTGTAFADAYPALAVLQESLADLNTRLAEPVPMARFRPNIVVAGAGAWSEDRWRALRIGDSAWDAVKPCDRCVVTTTDQMTGARDPRQEPLRTLATFRTVPGLGAIFGQNLVPARDGTIRQGDAVELG